MSLLFNNFPIISEANTLSGLVERQGRIQTLKLIFHFEMYYLHTLECNTTTMHLTTLYEAQEWTYHKNINVFCSTLDNYSCCWWKSSSCLWLAKFPFYPTTNWSDFSVATKQISSVQCKFYWQNLDWWSSLFKRIFTASPYIRSDYETQCKILLGNKWFIGCNSLRTMSDEICPH